MNLLSILRRIVFAIKRRKSFLKSLRVYTFTNIIEASVPFFLMPVLTRLLSTFDYGIITNFNAIRTNISPVISMTTPGAVGRAYYDRDNKGFDFHVYVFNALLVNFGLLLIMLVAVTIFNGFIPRIKEMGVFWLFLIPIFVWATATASVKVKLWIYQQNPRSNSIFRILQSLVEFGMSILLVSIFFRNWKGRIIGIGITEIVFCVIAVYALYKYDKLNPVLNIKYIRDILKFGLPLLPYSFGWMLIWTVDKYFLNYMAGVTVTGVYGVAYAIASCISLLAAPVDTLVEPILYGKLSNLNDYIAKKIVIACYGYFFLLIMAALLLWLVSPIILWILVDKKFWGARDYILWIGLGYSAYGMSRLLNGFINYSKKTYLISYNTLITGLIAVAANYVLIKLNGAVGAAQATCLAYITHSILTWRIANKLYPMPWFSIFKPRNLKMLFQPKSQDSI